VSAHGTRVAMVPCRRLGRVKAADARLDQAGRIKWDRVSIAFRLSSALALPTKIIAVNAIEIAAHV
jgi:hypothetical protein